MLTLWFHAEPRDSLFYEQHNEGHILIVQGREMRRTGDKRGWFRLFRFR